MTHFFFAFKDSAINQCWSKRDIGLNTLPFLYYASNSVRNHTYLHICALISPAESPWARLYQYGDNLSFLSHTRLSCLAFNQLFDVLFLDEQMQRAGTPQLMHPPAQLGLYLLFIGSTMGNKHLCLIFGITPAVCSRVINKMLLLVVRKL
jgi:hypothetical protein